MQTIRNIVYGAFQIGSSNDEKDVFFLKSLFKILHFNICPINIQQPNSLPFVNLPQQLIFKIG